MRTLRKNKNRRMIKRVEATSHGYHYHLERGKETYPSEIVIGRLPNAWDADMPIFYKLGRKKFERLTFTKGGKEGLFIGQNKKRE